MVHSNLSWLVLPHQTLTVSNLQLFLSSHQVSHLDSQYVLTPAETDALQSLEKVFYQQHVSQGFLDALSTIQSK